MERKRTYYNCAVRECLNSTINSDLSYFKLPVCSQRRAQWLKLIDREDLTDATTKHTRVCEAHFNPQFLIVSAQRKRLRLNAIPQLLLPNNIATKGTQTSDTEDTIPTHDIKLECDQDVQSNDFQVFHVQIPSHSSNDTPQKRRQLDENQIQRKRLKLSSSAQAGHNMFNKLCNKFLNKTLACIVKQQAKINIHGTVNKFSSIYKIFCLNLYYASPQAYELLKDTLSLPSEPSLIKMYIPVTTKIDDHLLQALKTNTQHMSDLDRNCSLVVSALSVRANLFYNIKEDTIYGFHEVDGVQSPEPAMHGLVAIIQGLYENYEQPVGFALTAECRNYDTVSDWIDNLILKLFSVGFHVRSLVSDMAFGFFYNAKNRVVTPESPYFFIGNRKIYYIFDTPHLFELVKKNFMKYNFHFENNVAKWDHVVKFYEIDRQKRLKLAPKITENHINPMNHKNMKVKYAVQVLSATVAAGISTYVDFEMIENSASGTVTFIELMNNLFDFLNSSSRQGQSKYQNSYYGAAYQVLFVNQMLDFFSSLKLINPNNGQEVTSNVKFIKCFQINLKSISLLFKDLTKQGFSYILTGRLNQDCLENFSTKIRSEYGSSTNPTSWQLVSAFRKKFLTHILKSAKNCAEDLVKCLVDSDKQHGLSPEREYIQESVLPNEETVRSMMPLPIKEEPGCTDNPDNITSPPKVFREDYNTLDLPENNAIVYISAYLLNKCLEQHKDCNEFTSEFISLPQDSTFDQYKNYIKHETKPLPNIPPDSFVEFVRLMEEKFCNFFETHNYVKCSILKTLLHEVQDLTFPVPCECFPLEYCKNMYLRMRIYYLLKLNNLSFKQYTRRGKIFTVKSVNS